MKFPIIYTILMGINLILINGYFIYMYKHAVDNTKHHFKLITMQTIYFISDGALLYFVISSWIYPS